MPVLDGVATAGGIYAPMGDLYAADWAVLEAAITMQGCLVKPSATSGRLDLEGGLLGLPIGDVPVAAVTAISSKTITQLASDAGLVAGQAVWIACELDVLGSFAFNPGAADQADTTHSPVKPTPTALRSVPTWLFVPFGATEVDTLLGTPNGKAKLVDARLLRSTPNPSGWVYEHGTLVYGSATKLATAGNKTAVYRKGTRLSYYDGAVDYNVVAASSCAPASPLTGVSTNVSTDTINKGTNDGLANGQAVTVTGLSNTAGITNGSIYFIVGATSSTAQLAATVGGSAIDLTGSADTNVTVTGATVIDTFATSDYAVANATISRVRYSYAANPQGWPSQFNWTPTYLGFSGVTGTYQWEEIDGYVSHTIRESGAGTSSATTHFYLGLPCTSASGPTNHTWIGKATIVDNGTTKTSTFGCLAVGVAVTSITISTDPTSIGTWTASGGCRVIFGDVRHAY